MKQLVKIFLLLFLFARTAYSQKVEPVCNAWIENKMLVIKNDKMMLYYDLADNHIKFSAYHLTGRQKVVFKSPEDDFKFNAKQLISSISPLKTEMKKKFEGENQYLEISLEFKLNNLQAKRIWELHAGIAAVSTYYLFKGAAPSDWLQTTQKSAGTEMIENSVSLNSGADSGYLGIFELQDPHYKAKIVSFADATDSHNNLVNETDILPYVRPANYPGNLLVLRNEFTNAGLFILKESPLSFSQQTYPGFDFTVTDKKVKISGNGVSSSDIDPDNWIKSYAYTFGFSTADETEQLSLIRSWQKTNRILKAGRDEMIMSNTWGDRSRDGKMNESFILKELEAGAKLGITHFQLDDGWQQGLSVNSASSQGKRWNDWTAADWEPHKLRFPNGFDPIVKKAKELNIQLALWFNPGSNNDYKNWLESANILIGYYKKFNINTFKIDGVNLNNKESEVNLGRFFQYVTEATQGKVTFDLDVTAGKRGGYYYFNSYGNIFLENRYTDWGNYYPHYTLRNLWQLSKYMPVEKLQAEWLNSWRNKDMYLPDDLLAPSRMRWDYLMATTFAAQPLAWMEISSLPEDAFQYAPVLKAYQKIQHELHQGIILPIGNEPDGRSWTGFQSIGKEKGFFILFRENTAMAKSQLKTYLKAGSRIKLTAITGQGKSFETWVDSAGQILFELPERFNYALYRYEIY